MRWEEIMEVFQIIVVLLPKEKLKNYKNSLYIQEMDLMLCISASKRSASKDTGVYFAL